MNNAENLGSLGVSHEFHETCHSVTFYFMKKTNFLILAGGAFFPNMIGAVKSFDS